MLENSQTGTVINDRLGLIKGQESGQLSKSQINKLQGKVYKISQLSQQDLEEMFQLMSTYYNNVNFQQFSKDLNRKSGVIILRDPFTNAVGGFSTFQYMKIEVQGKVEKALFSGDTVVGKKYWGQKSLGKAFLKHLFWQKLKSPFRPYYWLLMSKGYKTYLLMANNFSTHFPRYEKPTPSFYGELIDKAYGQLFPSNYQKESGLVCFDKNACYLKMETAPISEKLIGENSRIAFFEKQNPGWQEGNELACVAEMTFYMPFYYQLKFVKRKLVKLRENYFAK